MIHMILYHTPQPPPQANMQKAWHCECECVWVSVYVCTSLTTPNKSINNQPVLFCGFFLSINQSLPSFWADLTANWMCVYTSVLCITHFHVCCGVRSFSLGWCLLVSWNITVYSTLCGPLTGAQQQLHQIDSTYSIRVGVLTMNERETLWYTNSLAL